MSRSGGGYILSGPHRVSYIIFNLADGFHGWVLMLELWFSQRSKSLTVGYWRQGRTHWSWNKRRGSSYWIQRRLRNWNRRIDIEQPHGQGHISGPQIRWIQISWSRPGVENEDHSLDRGSAKNPKWQPKNNQISGGKRRHMWAPPGVEHTGPRRRVDFSKIIGQI